MRAYDKDLVSKIREKEYIEVVDGIEILMKPVPDDNRRNVLDPRVLEIAKRKKAMFSERAKGGFKLSNERYRPDKVTVDLTSKNIECEERLIPIDHNHMIDIFIYRNPDLKEKLPVMIYFHGGGMTAGDMKLYKNQMRLIAELANAVVIFPEYRLAPECPYPGPNQDAWGCVRWVNEHADLLNVDCNRLMVAGDSAGGALTNYCLLKDKAGIIKKAFEIYPGVNWKKADSHWSYDAYPIVEEQKEYAYSRIDRIKNGMTENEKESLYLQGKASFDDPYVSVLYATDEQIKHFPSMVVVASEYDYLRICNDDYVRKLRGAGVDVKAIRYCGCDHGFFDLLGTIVQAEELCLTIAEEINRM